MCIRDSFWAGLFLAAFCIVWNIMCTLLLKQGSAVPLEVNLFTNTVYFILAVLSGSVIALFVFGKMLEHVYDRRCMKRAAQMVIGLTWLYACLLYTSRGRSGVYRQPALK